MSDRKTYRLVARVSFTVEAVDRDHAEGVLRYWLERNEWEPGRLKILCVGVDKRGTFKVSQGNGRISKRKRRAT